MNCNNCVHEKVCNLYRQNESQDAMSFSESEDRCSFFQEKRPIYPHKYGFDTVECPYCGKTINLAIEIEDIVELVKVRAYDHVEDTLRALKITLCEGAEEKQDGKHWLRLEDPYGPRRPDTGPDIPPDSPAYGFCE